MTIFQRAWTFFARLFAKPYRAVSCEDPPEAPEPKKVYLVGDGDQPWSAALLCPCGCEALIQVSLMPDDRPRWRWHVHGDGTVSLNPSVWRRTGCRSHFVMRRGRILWFPERIFPRDCQQ